MKQLLMAAFVVVLAGCSGSPSLPARHPVSGTVTYKGGGPVVGRIIFSPADGSPYVGDAILGKDGKFSLQTLRHTSEEREPGVPAGEYTVSVVPVLPKPPAIGTRPDIPLPDPVVVKEGENVFSFEVPRR